MSAGAALGPDERLNRARMRASLLGSMLWATAAGDALVLSGEELRALAGYLEDLRDDLAIVQDHDYREAMGR